jgi:hypothetical protein
MKDFSYMREMVDWHLGDIRKMFTSEEWQALTSQEKGLVLDDAKVFIESIEMDVRSTKMREDEAAMEARLRDEISQEG